MCVPAFSFSPMVTNHFFSSFLLHSLHVPHLFSLHPLILSNSSIFSFSLFLSSSSPMAPKAKKSSYVLFANAFHLTCWSRATRFVGPPPLTYRPKNHIPLGESVSFSFFFLIFKFLSDLWFECVFGYLNAWVLLWDGFRWKLDVLGGVGTCLGWILDDASLKMLKNYFCLCSCVRRLELAYATCIHVYAALFLRTQVCSWESTYVGMNLCTRGLVRMHGLWPPYERCLAEALLYPFLLIFHSFYFPMQR